jgi:hypothetical protein
MKKVRIEELLIKEASDPETRGWLWWKFQGNSLTEDDVREILAMGCIAAWRSRHTFVPPVDTPEGGSFRAWFRKILYNEGLHYLEERGRRTVLPPSVSKKEEEGPSIEEIIAEEEPLAEGGTLPPVGPEKVYEKHRARQMFLKVFIPTLLRSEPPSDNHKELVRYIIRSWFFNGLLGEFEMPIGRERKHSTSIRKAILDCCAHFGCSGDEKVLGAVEKARSKALVVLEARGAVSGGYEAVFELLFQAIDEANCVP